jgi:hypothetical protein
MLGIPIEHRALLRIIAPRLVDDAQGVAVLGIEQAHVRRIVHVRHMILKGRLQREQLAAGGVPGNRPTLADVTEEMVLRSFSDLRDSNRAVHNPRLDGEPNDRQER